MTILAQQNPNFQPAMRIISSITNANPAVVTTTFDHNYSTGEIVRIRIGPGGGMFQIDKEVGAITVTGNTTFTFPLDSTNFDIFVVPADIQLSATTNPVTSAQKFYTSSVVVPIGEVNNLLSLATRNVL